MTRLTIWTLLLATSAVLACKSSGPSKKVEDINEPSRLTLDEEKGVFLIIWGIYIFTILLLDLSSENLDTLDSEKSLWSDGIEDESTRLKRKSKIKEKRRPVADHAGTRFYPYG